MTTFNQIRENVGQTWQTLAEGWRHLREKAGQALTRFTPREQQATDSTQQRVTLRSPQWGLLAAEISEDEQNVLVCVEIPGMESTDFQVEVRDDHLTVRGEKALRREHTRGRFHMTECAYGQFQRTFLLPVSVDDAGAKAKYQNGVLRVVLPKSNRGRKMSIPVAR